MQINSKLKQSLPVFVICLLCSNLSTLWADNSGLYAPNAYVVAPGNTVYIPIKKAYVVWENIPDLKATQADLSGNASAELLWQDAKSLISEVQLINSGENAFISVSTNNEHIYGNAVVTIKIAGSIRWSWHVWVTDYDSPQETISYTGEAGEITFMTRNLGAVEIDDAGMLYQFGRNTPFTASAESAFDQNYSRLSKTIYDINNTALTEGNPQDGAGFNSTLITESNRLAEAIQNPFVFYIGTENNQFDWLAPDMQVDTLWRNTNGGKGIFDPSPEGWRIPTVAEYNFLMQISESTLSGFTKAGSRDYSNGTLFMNREQGMYWSADTNEALSYYTFISDDFIDTNSSHYRSNAYAVRCIKDESWASNIKKTEENSITAFSGDKRIVVDGLRQNTVLHLYDICGRVIESKQAKERTTIGTDLPHGIYVLKIQNTQNIVLKVMVE